MGGGFDQLVKKNASTLVKPKLTQVLFSVANPSRYQPVMEAVKHHCKVTSIDQGWAAVEHGVSEQYDAAIIEVDMPSISGFEVVKRITKQREDSGLKPLPILFIGTPSQLQDGLEPIKHLCDVSLEFPFQPGHFMRSLNEICDIRAEQHWEELNYLQQTVLKVTKNSIKKMFDSSENKGIIKPELFQDCSRHLVEAARNKDLGDVMTMLKKHHSYTFVHVLKVSSLMTIFGAEIGLSDRDMELLAQGGLMHDVGKRDTPVELLEKPSKLDPDEWKIMQGHVTLSGTILRASPGIPKEVIQIAERHHEKIDGTGYPYGLMGKDIDDLSLIAAIMDIYSALTDKRAYKKAMSQEQALKVMDIMAGHHIEEGFYGRFKTMVLDGAMGHI